MTARTRLAIVASHPIQHFVHLYRALALQPQIELKVFFCSRVGLETYFDAEMNCDIAWNTDLLGGYDHVFLPEAERIKQATSLQINNPSIAGALAAYRPTAVMVYGYAHVTTLRAIAWCRLHGAPILMTGDGDDVKERPALKAAVRNGALRLLLSQVSALLTVGNQNERMLQGLGVPARRMFRTPFPIDEPAYRKIRCERTATRRALRSELGLDDESFVALFVGKLSQRKRPMDIVNAWEVMKRSGGPADRLHLLFCGEGAEREALVARARETGANVTLAGFVNVDQLPRYFCAADVMVQSSDHDPHPLVCSEGAAIGLPLILSDRIGLIGASDIGREGDNACVYACGDVTALAKKIEYLMLHLDVCRSMSEASIRIYEECGLEAGVAGVLGALASLPRANSAPKLFRQN